MIQLGITQTQTGGYMSQEELNEKNKQVFVDLFKLLNSMTNDDDLAVALADHLRQEHRTLQQSFWRMIQETSHLYEQQTNGFTDLRNEASLEFTKQVNKISTYLQFI